jgi:hypothetical protein
MFAKESEVSLWELNHQKDRGLFYCEKGCFLIIRRAGARTHLLVQQFVRVCFQTRGISLSAAFVFWRVWNSWLALQQSAPPQQQHVSDANGRRHFFAAAQSVFCDATTDL